MEIRDLIAKNGWSKVVAFQTRNPMHRAHEELCRMAHEALGTVRVMQTIGMMGVVALSGVIVNGALVLVRAKQELLQALEPTGLLDRIGRDRIYPTLPTLVEAFRAATQE